MRHQGGHCIPRLPVSLFTQMHKPNLMMRDPSLRAGYGSGNGMQNQEAKQTCHRLEKTTHIRYINAMKDLELKKAH